MIMKKKSIIVIFAFLIIAAALSAGMTYSDMNKCFVLCFFVFYE